MYEIKSILLPFNTTQPTMGSARSACDIASEHNSYIEGAYYHQNMPLIAGEGITLPGDYLMEFEEESGRQAKLSESSFMSLVSKFEIPFESTESSRSSTHASWRDMTDMSPNNMGEYARLFDLSIIERGGASDSLNWKATAEMLMFDSGRPVMVVGSNIPEKIGRKVIIAWNGSIESVRAVIASRPFLERCEELVILQVKGGMTPGPDAMQISKYLEKVGIHGSVELIDTDGASIGGSILRFAQDHCCDLLIKGAFTQSRFRQLIFGGATREILEEGAVPVLFCH